MIIGIDGNEANIENKVGVNVYAYELISSLKKLEDKWKSEHKIYIYLSSNQAKDLPKESDNFKYKIIPGSSKWILKKLTPHLFKNPEKLDVFFTPSHYIPPFSFVKRVCSIMDLGYLEFSGQFRKYDYWQLKLWSAWSIRASKRVLTISEATKKDIVRHYKSSKKKVVVTLPGYDSTKFNLNISEKLVRQIKNKYLLGDNYILFLSTLKPSKNIEGLIDAWSQIQEKFPEQKLVIVGKKGWLYESIFNKVKKLNLENRIVFTDYIDEKDKPAIFGGAKVFVLPSFWEGFGLDVLNAMASGVPVVVSNRASLPEVVGDAGLIINPDSPKDLADKIERVLSMSKTDYNRQVTKGLSRVKEFSWEHTATKTLEAITNLNNK